MQTQQKSKCSPEESLEKLRSQLLLTQDTRLKKLIQACIKRIELGKKKGPIRQ